MLDEGGGSIRKDQGHPTQKPVALFATPILNHTKESEVVFEPFAGSGSQFIAAQQLKRRCFGIEIEPGYCDVVCRRFANLTGIAAVLESSGRTFDQVAEERASAPKRPAKNRKAA